MRITVQLIEAETGTHPWADRFNGSVEEVFELQDQIASNVVDVIHPACSPSKSRRSAERATKDLTAYDLNLCALPLFCSLSKAGIDQALKLLDPANRA